MPLDKKDREALSELFSEHAGTIRDAVIAETRDSEGRITKTILDRINELENTYALDVRVRRLEKEHGIKTPA